MCLYKHGQYKLIRKSRPSNSRLKFKSNRMMSLKSNLNSDLSLGLSSNQRLNLRLSKIPDRSWREWGLIEGRVKDRIKCWIRGRIRVRTCWWKFYSLALTTSQRKPCQYYNFFHKPKLLTRELIINYRSNFGSLCDQIKLACICKGNWL